MKKKLFFGFYVLFYAINIAYAYMPTEAEAPYAFSSTTDAKRFNELTKEIRCVVCQNQNIADSHAPLANDLRDKVYQMVLEHKSNTEIKTYLVKRYGEFILLRPRFISTNLILWGFPFLAIMLAFYMLGRVVSPKQDSA